MLDALTHIWLAVRFPLFLLTEITIVCAVYYPKWAIRHVFHAADGRELRERRHKELVLPAIPKEEIVVMVDDGRDDFVCNYLFFYPYLLLVLSVFIPFSFVDDAFLWRYPSAVLFILLLYNACLYKANVIYSHFIVTDKAIYMVLAPHVNTIIRIAHEDVVRVEFGSELGKTITIWTKSGGLLWARAMSNCGKAIDVVTRQRFGVTGSMRMESSMQVLWRSFLHKTAIKR